MFKSTDDKIGKKEFLAMIIIMFYSKVTDSTPTIFFKQGKNAGWITPLISAIIMFISLSIILHLIKKYDGKGLIDVIYLILGKYFGFILTMMIMLTFLVFTFTNSRSYVAILVILFFPKTDIRIIYVSLMLTSVFIASRGFKGIGRTARVFFPYVVIAMTTILFLAWQNSRTEFLYPLQGAGVLNLLRSGFMLNSVFAEIIILTIFAPMIKDYKEFKTSAILGFWLSVLNMICFFAVYVMNFDYPAIIIINYIFHTLTRFISIGRFFTNVESIFLLFWIIIAVTRYAVYLYAVSGIFAYGIKTTKVEPLIPAFSAIAFFLGLIPENHIIAVQVIRVFNLYITSMLFVAFPLLLLIVSAFKGRIANDKK